MSRPIVLAALLAVISSGPPAVVAQQGIDAPQGIDESGEPPAEESAADEAAESADPGHVRMLASAVRHELATLPDYDVFDWIEAEVFEDGTVVLTGKVVEPTTRDRAEARLEELEEITSVVNEIEVLPLSSADDALRIAIYRALFNWNSPLFRYATSAVPPIHIIVDNGRVTLEGQVASEMDRQLAEARARGVPGVFGVENRLRVL